ncbi:MAG: hypothetical protein WD772_13490 [Pseudohongiellaceae bacterium]
MKNATYLPPLFLLSLWMLALPLPAQEAEVQTTDESNEQDPPVPIEEITIVGERTLLTMRHQIEREEENLYSLFNDLNSSDDMDIICRMVKKRLSHISERVCEPMFLTKQRTESNRNSMSDMRQAWSDEGIDPVLFMNALETMESEVEIIQKVEPQYEALSEEMLRIAQENPDYFARLQKIGAMKTELEQARQRQFGSD